MIYLDTIELLWLFLGVMTLFAGGFLVGRWADPTWKTKQKRTTFKENAYMLAIISKDRRTIQKIAVKPTGQVLKVGDALWIIDPKRIYREDKPESGLKVKPNLMKYEEGVPTLYVYEDSLKPAEFNPEPSKVSPNEIATGLEAYLAVERAKIFTGVKQYQTFFMIIMLLGVLNLAGHYMNAQPIGIAQNAAQACDAKIQLVMNHFGIALGENVTAPINTTNTIAVQGG